MGLPLAVLVAAAIWTGGPLVGPGPVKRSLDHGAYHLSLEITPNKGGLIRNEFRVRVTSGGRAVRGGVFVRFTMRAMPMPPLALRLHETAPGRFEGTGFKLTMIGRWEIRFHVTPRDAPPFDVVLIDRVRL